MHPRPVRSTARCTGTERVRRSRATLPIVAYQFNPLDNVDVFSNDASLLIPRTAFDTTYYVMSWPTLDNRDPAPGTSDFYGYLTVVAWQDGTVIEVTPTAAVEASATMSTIAAGTPTQFTLNAFEVLVEPQEPPRRPAISPAARSRRGRRHADVRRVRQSR